jgi:3-oxoacyl-[acyl-carrier-protein] synthase II
MGVVSPIGSGVATFWDALCAGASGIRPITRFETENLLYNQGGEITELPELPDGFDTADPALRFLAAAAREAVCDAGLQLLDDLSGVGTVLSTNFGCAGILERILAEDPLEQDTDNAFPDYGFQRAADRVAGCWNFGGPRAVLSLSCASGAAALGWGASLVRSGRARAVLTGGFDALSLFSWSGLSALRTMTRDKLRPFDARRNGTLFSEGAAVLVVEDLEHARSRGAEMHAEILGYATNNNAFHMTAPPKRGAGSAAVMRDALADAGVGPEDIDHVNAHGTGTKHNDVTETQAIKDVFGPHAAKIPVTSSKASTGHMMGAAGTIEAIATVLSLRTGVVPPTLNFQEADPECDLNYVFHEKQSHPIHTALSNSAGIGGCNAAVVLRALSEETCDG